MSEVPQHEGGGALAIAHIVFMIVGFSYGAQVLHPIPMTYLSEIAFPFDFCVKLTASLALSLLHTTHWLIDMREGVSWHQRASASTFKQPTTNQDSHVFLQQLAWSVSTVLLWMEHRRSRSPSLLIRVFWMTNWIQVSVELFTHQSVAQLDLGTPTDLPVIMAALTYSCSAILGASCFFTATPVTTDLIHLPLLATPSAYLHSANFKFPLSSYGTFGNYDITSRNSLALKTDEDRNIFSAVSNYSVSRGGAISATIPSSTMSTWGKNRFISYKIVVQSEDDRWSVRRQYSDFVTLYEELPEIVKVACPLPQDYNDHQYLSWKRKATPMKTRLEKFLQRVLAHKSFEPYSSQSLCDFLEMEYVDEALLQAPFSGPPSGGNWFSQAESHTEALT